MRQQLMVAYLKNVPFLIFDSILFDRRILRVYCIRCWVYLSIHTYTKVGRFPVKFSSCVGFVCIRREGIFTRVPTPVLRCGRRVLRSVAGRLDSIPLGQSVHNDTCPGGMSSVKRQAAMILTVWSSRLNEGHPTHTHTHDPFATERAANVTRRVESHHSPISPLGHSDHQSPFPWCPSFRPLNCPGRLSSVQPVQ